mgnify:FL=1
MNISLQVKEAHLVVTNDNGEVGYAYSVKDVDMNISPIVLIQMAGQLFKAFSHLNETDTAEPDYAAARGFTTHNKGMPKKAPAFADDFSEFTQA